jgi:hypothetical protein
MAYLLNCPARVPEATVSMLQGQRIRFTSHAPFRPTGVVRGERSSLAFQGRQERCPVYGSRTVISEYTISGRRECEGCC